MGRKRIHFTKIENNKILKCEGCGAELVCSSEAVKATCGNCVTGFKPIPENAPIPELVSISNNEKTEPTEKKKRGRPRKNPIIEVKDEKKIKAQEKGKKMNKTTKTKKVDVKGGTGKRGRKANVGVAVLNFIQSQRGEVKFGDIVNVYSAERDKLGKKATPEIEARNCYSTLYIMQREGKIREIQKKSLYAAC